ncbi:hypothetical protein MKL09_07765, partial [Methylobacterium sp. J-048]|nr:hypothetical protein [Methylobacterium sp. J-048]
AAGRRVGVEPARHAASRSPLEAGGEPVLPGLRRTVLAGGGPGPARGDGRLARSPIRAGRAQGLAMCD